MTVYILDSSALLRFLDKEAGYARVREVLQQAQSAAARVEMCAVHWGEVVLVLMRRHAPLEPHSQVEILKKLPIHVVSVTEARAERTAHIRLKYKIPHADAFGVELAGTSPDHSLITADFDVKSADSDYRIEFLPIKPRQ